MKLNSTQNVWQGQEFVRVAKTRVRNDAFYGAGARILCFARLMFEVWDAQSVEGLQILESGHVTLQASFRVAVTGVRLPRLNFFRCRRSTFEASASQLRKRIVILRSGRVVNMSSLKEVSQKSFVFEARRSFLSFAIAFLKELQIN